MKFSDILGKKSSRILLGTAYFGDGISQDAAFKIMDRYCELGGCHIDTARLYANGASEEVVGQWVKSRGRADIFVSTKGGYYEGDAGEAPRICEKEIRSDLEKSLLALGFDCADFYWLHKDDENVPVEEIISLMNKLVKEGKIKKFGASNWRAQRIEEANRFAKENGLIGFSASQMRFNPAYCLGERGGLVGMDNDEYSCYKRLNIPVMAYSSQAKGFFSKMSMYGESALSEKAKKRYLCDENIRRLKVLELLSEKYNCSIASVISAAFSSFENPIVFPIIGTGSITQLEDTMAGQDITLEKSELTDVFGLDI